MITFDDGYRSLYEEAFPVLQRYEMSATVFFTVGEKGTATPADRLPCLNWREIRETHRPGIAFGAHTLTRPDLTHSPLDRVEAEICGSKAIIEDTLSTPVACFAYPYGRYDYRRRDIARHHSARACSDRLSLVMAGSDPYALEPADAYYLRTDRLFGLVGMRLFPWYIWVLTIPRRMRRAVQLGSG